MRAKKVVFGGALSCRNPTTRGLARQTSRVSGQAVACPFSSSHRVKQTTPISTTSKLIQQPQTGRDTALTIHRPKDNSKMCQDVTKVDLCWDCSYAHKEHPRRERTCIMGRMLRRRGRCIFGLKENRVEKPFGLCQSLFL